MGAGKLLWGYHPATKTWIPLQVDANGKAIVNMSAIKLNDLGDVRVPAPADQNFLYWDDVAGEWTYRILVDTDIPAGIARDAEVATAINDLAAAVTLAIAAIELNDLADVEVPAPADGYVVYWDNATSLWKCKAPVFTELLDTDLDTGWNVEQAADEDKIHGKVKGVEAFLLSDKGILTLAKQSSSKAWLDGDWGGIPTTTGVKVPLNTIVHDIQSEWNVRRLTGTADATGANKLHDADGGFEAADVGASVHNTTDDTFTTVAAFVDSGELTLADDIMVNGETYTLYHARWTCKEDGKYLTIASVAYRTTNMEDQKAHQCRILKNEGAFTSVVAPSSGAIQMNVIAQDILSLVVDDYLELGVWHNGTLGNMRLRGLVAQTFLSIMKVA